jgi:hypothetical protein
VNPDPGNCRLRRPTEEGSTRSWPTPKRFTRAIRTMHYEMRFPNTNFLFPNE